MKTIERKQNELIEVSVAPKDYNGAKNRWFSTESVRIKDLPELFKKNNYSLLHWKDGTRKASNFIKAVGFVGDVDSGLDIHSAHERLKRLNLNHLIIPSKSHTAGQHKFHFPILFDKPVYSVKTYKLIAEHISQEIIPESDSAVTDAARYIYGSKEDAEVSTYWDGKDLEVSGFGELWDANLVMIDSEGEEVSVSDLTGHTIIYCPFHDDNSTSAFIDHAEDSNNWYISCSSCEETFWMEKNQSRFEIECESYWSYGTDVWDFGMINDKFFHEMIGQQKFYIKTNSEQSEDKKKAFRYLVKHKHIRHLCRIDYVSNIEAEESNYQVDLDTGVIRAEHKALSVVDKDNDFIEEYLEDRFGTHKTFIKEWLAVFCYTNYQKLPTLILTGGRGSGKSTFAEIIADIFPTLSMQWSGNEADFTYEVEKKLLIVEENLSDKVSQYKTLKKYSGQKYATVKKKFKDPYQVWNNMNIMLLSNEAIALYVNREEMPTDSKNNQFFVYEFPDLNGTIDPQIQQKLIDRLGHYIRTELKNVFYALNMDGYRYSIDGPITESEEELFRNNTTDLQLDVDVLMEKLADQFSENSFPTDQPIYKFVKKGYLPVFWIKYYSGSQKHYNQIIKGMKRLKLLVGSAEKVQAKKERKYCFKMTDKLKNMINDPQILDLEDDIDAKVSGVSKQLSLELDRNKV